MSRTDRRYFQMIALGADSPVESVYERSKVLMTQLASRKGALPIFLALLESPGTQGANIAGQASPRRRLAPT